ncbi:DegT/DnrJ/EryC1/StrS family aminotransferase [Synechococcus sp. A10-1-5-1]|uniref:DegT/DnrJ/EryC1/StrS family aminotransferase n=1 Tax=Synechococcus sp. A10-1-5-1 TaxID=2936507 RepID=UPI002000E7BE|nr:DegT/DnrJ/EryC1/StrS family aminotransferase [Synechococcus sp. A10-1-5-1]UPM49216.1 DegT/DnrJ/EryC1/StrS family aminotransferase [Synechococcus sp. A10-1-5-1]
MTRDFIPVNTPLLQGKESLYLQDCIETGWISSEGGYVSAFEENVARYVGRKYAIAVSNGTAALDVAVASLNIGPGDEVIIPSFTIISCIHQVLRSGATPVFVDCFPDTFNINSFQIESLITPRTKAIIAVHIYGLPVDLNPILEICNSYGIHLIEDTAEMLGQKYYERRCGSFGDISTLSFYPNKIITTGEGGMILTDDPGIAERCRSLRNLCFSESNRFVHTELGWNYRMSNLQAAVGLAQLEKIDTALDRKRYIGATYDQLLSDIPAIKLPVASTSYASNIYWVYPVVLDSNLGLSAKEFAASLKRHGIGTRPFFYPLHLQPVLSNYESRHSTDLTTCESLHEYGLYIPSGLGLDDHQISIVSESIHLILEPYIS